LLLSGDLSGDALLFLPLIVRRSVAPGDGSEGVIGDGGQGDLRTCCCCALLANICGSLLHATPPDDVDACENENFLLPRMSSVLPKSVESRRDMMPRLVGVVAALFSPPRLEGGEGAAAPEGMRMVSPPPRIVVGMVVISHQPFRGRWDGGKKKSCRPKARFFGPD
jgi:hypothetical protein